MVKGLDGQEYGPVDFATLKQWVAEGRVTPVTQVSDLALKKVFNASEMPGLFPPPNYSVPGVSAGNQDYPRQQYGQTKGSGGDSGHLGGVIFRCILALVLFFLLNGIGMISAAYAMFYAWQNKDEEKGMIGLSIAGATLAILGIGWAVRLSQAPKITTGERASLSFVRNLRDFV